ncbi:MAG: cation:dicarboxylase symporter family transporter [Clostridia bacterium]|nr:cation:dicarboxylase symporter family transporter [Clostridia bacterium]
MLRKTQNETFDLSADGIDAFSLWLNDLLEGTKIDYRDRLRSCLMFEELLLRMSERLGDAAEVSAAVDVIFSSVRIRIEIPGDAFNPLSATAEELGDWNSSLITAIGLNTIYTYAPGKNILRLTLRNSNMNVVLKMAIAIAAGCTVGALGILLLPRSGLQTMTDSVLLPTFDIWSELLNTVSGPIIFFMAITTMLNTKGISRQGGSSFRTIGRYLLFSFLIVAGALILAKISFSFGQNTLETSQDPFSLGMQFILEMVPKDLLSPVMDSNTPQLLLMAVVLGAALIALGDRVKPLKNGIRQVNMIGLTLAKWMSLLVPFVLGLFLCIEIWSNQTLLLFGMWKPLALSLGVSVVVLVVDILWFSVSMKVLLRTAVRKLAALFLQTLRSGSVDNDVFDAAEKSCVRDLGIDRNYTKICLPQGIVLYVPISAIGILMFTVYALQVYNIDADVFWQIALVFFAVLLFVMTPPVPGANLLSYAVLFSWLGLPETVIIDAMVFEIVFGIFSSAANLTMLQIETVFQAKRLGMLNFQTLREAKK